jgi:hypothetical protein
MEKFLTFIFLIISAQALASWEAPVNPDPSKILDEAILNCSEKNYQESLEKQLWFHKNSLKISNSYRGVRLSYALSAWVNLGKVYPKAHEELINIRNETESHVKGGEYKDFHFNDLASINKYLGEDSKTTDIFKWLDKHDSKTAKIVYFTAQPALIKEKEYALARKYLDAESLYKKIVKSYKKIIKASKMPDLGQKMVDFGERYFSNKISTLIALLVLNNNIDEANNYAIKAKELNSNKNLHKEIDRALKGVIPDPWP